MFKNVIAPVQAWLLSQGKCVGCGSPLSEAEKKGKKNGMDLVICKCKRGYFFDSTKKTYRRALQSEIKS